MVARKTVNTDTASQNKATEEALVQPVAGEAAPAATESVSEVDKPEPVWGFARRRVWPD